MTARAIGYIRVSTTRQAEEGVSIDAQTARIRAWCDANGYSLADVFTDAGISGKRQDNRPGLRKALDAACKQRAALVVYSLSRLARSTRDAIEIASRVDLDRNIAGHPAQHRVPSVSQLASDDQLLPFLGGTGHVAIARRRPERKEAHRAGGAGQRHRPGTDSPHD